MRRDAVSVIYQNYNLFPLLTVMENIQYPLDLKKMPRKESVALAREVRERVELPANYDKRLPSHLSGGEQQRVAIARALAHRPKIIFADEPTAELDTATAAAVMKLFRDLIEKEDVTIVMTTHDVGLMSAGTLSYELEDGAVKTDAAQE